GSAVVPITRFSIALAEGQTVTNAGRVVVAISPDGSQMVYVANQRLYHRAMSDLDVRPIPGSEAFGAVLNPVFSPDGRSIVFLTFTGGQDATLRKIALTGGASVTLCQIEVNVFGMTWADGRIVFGQGSKG